MVNSADKAIVAALSQVFLLQDSTTSKESSSQAWSDTSTTNPSLTKNWRYLSNHQGHGHSPQHYELPRSREVSDLKALQPRAFLQVMRSQSPTSIRVDIEGEEFRLPLALGHLFRAVDGSRRILDLPPSFDEEGSPGYDKETWARSIATLLEGAIWVWTQFGDRIPAPAIGPGPESSIDLDWHKGERTLLLNFPADPQTPPTFYGDDGNGRFPLEGELDLAKDNNWLFVWLVGR